MGSNSVMVDMLVSSSLLTSQRVEGAFRAVDRAMYFDMASDEEFDPYSDIPWRRGNLHISAPCIYAKVVEALDLRSGLSFLNLGSGTGYLSTIVGLLVGPNGLNYGVELHKDVVEFARRRLKQFKAISCALDKYDFSDPTFVIGNCLNLNPAIKYDRIYLGAACLPEQEAFMKSLLKPNGGILVMPYLDRLIRYVRRSELEWKVTELMTVTFTLMIANNNDMGLDGAGHLDPSSPGDVGSKRYLLMPLGQAKSLKELCRITIRQCLRAQINAKKPMLMDSSNMAARKLRLEIIERRVKELVEYKRTIRERPRLQRAANELKSPQGEARPSKESSQNLDKRRHAGTSNWSSTLEANRLEQGSDGHSKEAAGCSVSRVMTRSASHALRNDKQHSREKLEPAATSRPTRWQARSSKRGPPGTTTSDTNSSSALNNYRGELSLARHNRNNYSSQTNNNSNNNNASSSEPEGHQPSGGRTAGRGGSDNGRADAINLSPAGKQHCARTRPFVGRSKGGPPKLLHMRTPGAQPRSDHREPPDQAGSSSSSSSSSSSNSDSDSTISEALARSHVSSDSGSFVANVRGHIKDEYLSGAGVSGSPSSSSSDGGSRSASGSLFHYLHDTSLSSRLFSRPDWLLEPWETVAPSEEYGAQTWSASSSVSSWSREHAPSFSSSPSTSASTSGSNVGRRDELNESELDDYQEDDRHKQAQWQHSAHEEHNRRRQDSLYVDDIDEIFSSNLFDSDLDDHREQDQMANEQSTTLGSLARLTGNGAATEPWSPHYQAASPEEFGEPQDREASPPTLLPRRLRSQAGPSPLPVASCSRQPLEVSTGRNCRHLAECPEHICKPLCWRHQGPPGRLAAAPNAAASLRTTGCNSLDQLGASGSRNQTNNTCNDGHHQAVAAAPVGPGARASIHDLRRAERACVLLVNTSSFASNSRSHFHFGLQCPDLAPTAGRLARRLSHLDRSPLEGKRKRRSTSSSEESSGASWSGYRSVGSSRRARRRHQRHRESHQAGGPCGACSCEGASQKRLTRAQLSRRTQTNHDRPPGYLVVGDLLEAEFHLERVRRRYVRALLRFRRPLESDADADGHWSYHRHRNQNQHRNHRHRHNHHHHHRRRRRHLNRAHVGVGQTATAGSNRWAQDELRCYYIYMRAHIRKLPLPRILLSYLNYDDN